MPRTGQTAYRAVVRLSNAWDGLRRQHQDLIADLIDQLVDSHEAYLAVAIAKRQRDAANAGRVLAFPHGQTAPQEENDRRARRVP